jgi:hypothetical protein
MLHIRNDLLAIIILPTEESAIHALDEIWSTIQAEFHGRLGQTKILPPRRA